MQLCNKYPFLMKYFQEGIKSKERAIAHSILFYGNDITAQYDIAYEIARLLNCKASGDEGCECINCKWIYEHQHPAVLTVSKLDFKGTDDESKTVISMKQSQQIKTLLNTTSEFHRVFIFCDRGEEGEIKPLNVLNFQEETANSLLKIIEEPPERTTFFFLTRDKNDVIQTIISRSQSFFVPSQTFEECDFSDVHEIVENYWQIERREVFEFAGRLFDLSKMSNPSMVLDGFESYILAVLKSNFDNPAFRQKLLDDIKAVELAKTRVSLRINPQNAYENLALEII